MLKTVSENLKSWLQINLECQELLNDWNSIIFDDEKDALFDKYKDFFYDIFW